MAGRSAPVSIYSCTTIGWSAGVRCSRCAARWGSGLWITGSNPALAGYPLSRSVPVGYELAIVGCVLFPIGGVSDLIWHTVLGFERVLPVWSPFAPPPLHRLGANPVRPTEARVAQPHDHAELR